MDIAFNTEFNASNNSSAVLFFLMIWPVLSVGIIEIGALLWVTAVDLGVRGLRFFAYAEQGKSTIEHIISSLQQPIV